MIDTNRLEIVAHRVTELGFTDAGMAQLRADFPDIKITFCLEDELGVVEPFREYAGFSLYLVGGGDHCLSLTDSPERAAGLLVAEASD